MRFLFGFAIGVVIGLLYAPAAGEETREKLIERPATTPVCPSPTWPRTRRKRSPGEASAWAAKPPSLPSTPFRESCAMTSVPPDVNRNGSMTHSVQRSRVTLVSG